MYAIDPHTAQSDNLATQSPVPTFAEFTANIQRAGVAEGCDERVPALRRPHQLGTANLLGRKHRDLVRLVPAGGVPAHAAPTTAAAKQPVDHLLRRQSLPQQFQPARPVSAVHGRLSRNGADAREDRRPLIQERKSQQQRNRRREDADRRIARS